MLGECPRTPEEQRGCPFADKAGCFSNEHHTKWPKSRYRTPLERAYRELEEHRIQMCQWDHQLLHQIETPPSKPTISEMIVALTVSLDRELVT